MKTTKLNRAATLGEIARNSAAHRQDAGLHPVKPATLPEANERLAAAVAEAESAVSILTAKAEYLLRPIPQPLQIATLNDTKVNAPIVAFQLELGERLLNLVAKVQDLVTRLPV